MPRINPVVHVWVCFAAIATPFLAQDARGVVAGSAVAEETDAPIPFALVRLRPTVSAADHGAQRVTNAQGRYSFPSVPAGEYRLELLRIGYHPAISPVFRVHSGESVRQDVRGSLVGLPLPVVRVYADGACLKRDSLAMDPALAILWEEIQKGVEIRRAFERQYRYAYTFVQESDTRVPSRDAVRRQRTDTQVNDPDQALARDARRRAARSATGYGSGNTLQLPDEEELLDDNFLIEHCVIPDIRDSSGTLGLRFREATKRKIGYGLKGSIWVDESTRLIRRLELEYLDGDNAFSQVSLDYADIPTAGATLRLPRGGSFTLRPLQAPRGTTVTGSLSFGYGSFLEVLRR